MKLLHYPAFALVRIGAFNWLAVGLFQLDIVSLIFGGSDAAVSRIIYILIGAGAAYELVLHKKMCHTCTTGMHTNEGMMMENKGMMR